MAQEKRLTIFGKLVVFLFIAGCLYGAWRLLPHSSVTRVVPGLGGGTAPREPAPGVAPEAPGGRGARRLNVWQDIQRRREVRVGYESEAPPMYFPRPGGGQDGFEYQLAQKLAGAMGVGAVRFVEGSYQELPEMLRRGEIDLILAGYVPDPSLEGIEWSDSYLDFGLCLIVLRSSAVTDVSHLEGRTVAVYDDPAAVRWVGEHIPRARVRTYSGESGWFESLERREADGLIYDYPFAAAEIREHPRTKIVQFNLSQSHYAVGVPAGNDTLLDAVNGALRRLMASDAYGELVRTYLSYQSEDVSKPVPGRRTYVVRPGDTLTRIAQAELGAMDRWQDIWRLNKERIPNPHLIYPSYVLIMP